MIIIANDFTMYNINISLRILLSKSNANKFTIEGDCKGLGINESY